MAGINASTKLQGREPLVLGRHEAYIGVLIDDLITKGTNEPYRMFTSRAEYRLLLRHDNADLRLMDKGYETGLLDKDVYEKLLKKRRLIDEELLRIKKTRIKLDNTDSSEFLEQLLKKPEITYKFIEELSPSDKPLTEEIKKQVEIQVKYDGYIHRQMEMAERLKKIEGKRIPEDFNYSSVNGLSKEILSKLQEVRPANLGQANRIPGVTPAAISLLLVAIERLKRERGQKSIIDAKRRII
jgi:tRNA uridine 5-carboxymethylaminomethyl modification enzyme